MKPTLTLTLRALAASLLVAGAAHAAPIRNVALVHGFYADGSSWSEVIPRLQAAGLHVTSVQNPLTSLTDDVAAVQRVLALQDGPSVLVGHSYAGTVISQAGIDPKVAALVYVSARAPDAGEDYPALTARFAAAPASKGVVKAGGFIQLSEESFLLDFASDIPTDKARVLYAVQGRVADTLGATRTTEAAWHGKPTWYAISTRDRTTDPDLQRFLAKRMGAHTIELASSHLAMISHPADIAKLIIEATQEGAR